MTTKELPEAFSWLTKDYFLPKPFPPPSSPSTDSSDRETERLWPYWPNASEDSWEESCPSLISLPGLERPDEIINLRKHLFWSRFCSTDPVKIRKSVRESVKGGIPLMRVC